MDKLYIVIPAYNEQETIQSVIEDWHPVAVSAGADSRLVIIDDGSKDNTYAMLKEAEAKYPQLIALTKPNGGHGATLLYGYNYALEQGGDYVFQTDSDGQTKAEEFAQRSSQLPMCRNFIIMCVRTAELKTSISMETGYRMPWWCAYTVCFTKQWIWR